ncbi:MAG: hypothetical protein R2848_06730 [Thermomicrobiales bacterium]
MEQSSTTSGRGPILNTDAHRGRSESVTSVAPESTFPTLNRCPKGIASDEAPNVFITGHTSGRTPYYWQRGGRILRANIAHYLAGEPLENLVDYDLGY